MAAYTAELKDNNEDVVYPITTADSVVDSDNVSLQTRVNTGVFVGTGVPETPTPWVQYADLVWPGIFDKIYPVGSIFMSATLSTAADVATALGGGTWVEDTDFDLVAYAYVTNQTTIVHSKNITSVTGSAGTYTVNFSKDMADANYVAFVSGEVSNRGQEIIGIYDKTVSRFRYDFSNYSGSATSPSQINIAVFGRLGTPEIYKYKRTA